MNNPDGGRGDAIREEIALLRERREEHTDRHRSCCNVNAAVRRHLEMLPANAVLSDAKRIKVPPRAGESFADAVHRVRRDIGNLVAEKLQVQQAGLPIEEIRAKARDWISRHARTARPPITATPNEFAISFEIYDEKASVPVPDIGAIMAFLYPEKLAKRIDEAI
ncbi:hypothetical protein I6F30_10955 [Bradyrhizobium sp. NBAIM20]|uniref:hypothetical protein n=1 Tax=unclassified Bradyrhizobium TaxID=2631580 RepID=UPI001CD76AE1|nr:MULTISPECIES: hypothetical protein [unclassified Bradyrhizobium]MCA1411660.1 hypothetical protein [Bradyrhizobium sp. NBAIM20]MCA1461005.1 hypothetical protein [Bradyrhizobium sp. NBAIM18]